MKYCGSTVDYELQKLWSCLNALKLRLATQSPSSSSGSCCYDDSRAQNAALNLFRDTASVDFTVDVVGKTVSAVVPPQWVRDLFSAGAGLSYDPLTGQFAATSTDTNFATHDLVATATRTHNWAGYNFNLTNAYTLLLETVQNRAGATYYGYLSMDPSEGGVTMQSYTLYDSGVTEHSSVFSGGNSASITTTLDSGRSSISTGLFMTGKIGIALDDDLGQYWITNLPAGTAAHDVLTIDADEKVHRTPLSLLAPAVSAQNGLNTNVSGTGAVELGGTLLRDTDIWGGTSAQVDADTHYGMYWRDMNYFIVQGKYLPMPGQPSFQFVLNDNSFTYKFFAADNDTNFYQNWNGAYFFEQINDHGNYQLERYSGNSSTGVDLSYLKHGYEAEYQTMITNEFVTNYEIDTVEAWMMLKGDGAGGRVKLLHLAQGQLQPSVGGNGDRYATGFLATENAVQIFCGKIDETTVPWYDDTTQLAYKKGITVKYGGAVVLGVVGEYTDNAAALAAGLEVGTVYRTGDLLKIVH